MPTELEYSGAAVALPELTEIHIERAIPGGRYGVRSFNTRLCAAFSTPTDDAVAIGDRLKADMVAAGMRVTGSNPLLLTTQPGISSGLRIDSSPGSYISNVTPGVESTPKQIRVSVPVGASGGTWTLTFDFGDGDETTADLGPTALPASIVTAIEALATPLPGEVTVYLENPGNSLTSRSYLITIGGTLAGLDWTVTAEGAELEGVGRIETSKVQVANADSCEVQACWFQGYPNNGSENSATSNQMRIKFVKDGVSSAFTYGINGYDTNNPGTSAKPES